MKSRSINRAFLLIALAAVSCTCVCSQDEQAVEDFFHAIEHGDLTEVQRLVAINPGLVQARGGIDRNFEAALHIAACVGNWPLCAFYVSGVLIC